LRASHSRFSSGGSPSVSYRTVTRTQTFGRGGGGGGSFAARRTFGESGAFAGDAGGWPGEPHGPHVGSASAWPQHGAEAAAALGVDRTGPGQEWLQGSRSPGTPPRGGCPAPPSGGATGPAAAVDASSASPPPRGGQAQGASGRATGSDAEGGWAVGPMRAGMRSPRVPA
ncbi:hypothetical protein MNEG_13299, partial [Monoraphidium neglectum]